MPMTSKESRKLLLETLQSLKGLCRAIGRESKHAQEGCVWRGKPYTIIWQLVFDDESLEFKSQSRVLPEECLSPDMMELSARIQERLMQLRIHEEWLTSIPMEWLEL